jgi:Flp pilus assembly protein protease CpaA
VKNWKTTVAGILTAVIALSSAVKAMIDGDPLTNPDWPVVIGAITVAIGLLLAKDANPA